MTEFHQFGIALVGATFLCLFFLAILRRIVGGSWARTVERIAGVIFWSSALAFLVAYAYLLQASTLNRLIRSEIVPEEPWFAFLHQRTILTTPTVMAGILTFFAVLGGFLFAYYFDVLLSLIGFGFQWSNLSVAQRAAWVQQLVSCLVLITVGLLLVLADAKVFAFRWAYDLKTLEEQIGWEVPIARLVEFAYLAGMLFFTFVIHRKYCQFQEAAGLLPTDEKAQPQVRVRALSSQTQRSRSTASISTQDNGDQPFERQNVQQIVTNESAQSQRFNSPTQSFDYFENQQDEDGERVEVLPEHFNPFATRRR